MESPYVNAGHPTSVIGWSLATVAMWTSSVHLAFVGLSWEALGTLFGGAGTLIFALVAASKEIRGWLDRRNARGKSPATTGDIRVDGGPAPGGGDVRPGAGQ